MKKLRHGGMGESSRLEDFNLTIKILEGGDIRSKRGKQGEIPDH